MYRFINATIEIFTVEMKIYDFFFKKSNKKYPYHHSWKNYFVFMGVKCYLKY